MIHNISNRFWEEPGETHRWVKKFLLFLGLRRAGGIGGAIAKGIKVGAKSTPNKYQWQSTEKIWFSLLRSIERSAIWKKVWKLGQLKPSQIDKIKKRKSIKWWHKHLVTEHPANLKTEIQRTRNGSLNRQVSFFHFWLADLSVIFRHLDNNSI